MSKFLWVMRSPLFVRNHEAVLRELVARGHVIRIAFEGPKGEATSDLPRRLERELDGLTITQAALPRGPAALLVRRARGGLDWMRYLEPAYRDADALRRRAKRFALPGLTLLEPVLARRPAARRRARSALARLARAGRGSEAPIHAMLAHERPDALVVSPLMHFGSPQPDYVRVARELGIPSALVTYSWDNFTNKSLMHEVPDLVTVWNDVLAREAAFHHSVPEDRIAITGAPAYDHWFAWRSSRDRAEFCRAIGLDPGRPYLLYVCSSGFIAPDEPHWVTEWLAALRAPLPDVGVLVRPHPQNAEPWHGRSLPGAVVFPARGADPTNAQARADYYDSITHAAGIVGVNTTALIEGAILGVPSFTVRVPRYRGTQEGTLHFHALNAAAGGPVHVAATMTEHLEQLTRRLEAPTADASLSAFVERFVRPLGLDVPAGPLVADRLEALA